jgi:TPR repeat protein
MKQAILSLILAWAALSSVRAGPLEDGVAAFDRGNYATALGLLRPLASQGDASAQFYVGYMSESGRGVPQDYVEAASWYLKAAEQGDAQAQGRLGSMYYDGRGVPQDFAEAAKWDRKAAEYGETSAQLDLAILYASGQGVPQDYVQAHKWANLAAAGSLPSQTEFRAKAIKFRSFVAAKMTPAQIADAQRLASEWKPVSVPLQ